MNLYEINERILDCVDPETGEVVDIQMLEGLQMERDSKIENIALWIKNLLSDAEELDREKKKLAERQRTSENKAKSLKEYLSRFVNGEKFKTPRVSISWRKSESVSVDDISSVPDRFLKYSDPAPDKTAIKKAIKSGEDVPGARLIEGKNIQIK